MMKSKLTVCSSLLYHWIRLHSQRSEMSNFDPRNFQAWTGEFLEHAVSFSDIQAALNQLNQLNLIATRGNCVALRQLAQDGAIAIPPLPRCLSKPNNRGSWLTKMLLIGGLMVLWGGSLTLHLASQEAAPNQAISTEPHQVLGEKLGYRVSNSP